MFDFQLNKRLQSFFQLGLFVGIVIFANLLSQYFYVKLDLTEEKRFTLTESTTNLLQSLDDIVQVRVLLDGAFPAGFKRLQKETIELLEDFRGESGYIEYEFEDPSKGSTDQINARRQELAKDGIIPVNFRFRDKKGGTSSQIIYPHAIFYYKGRSLAVKLLENEIPGVSDEYVLNNSVGLLEYKFSNAIQKLKMDPSIQPAILFTAGHGELSPLETADLEKSLDEYYNTGQIILDSVTHIRPEVAVLIIAKPRYPFSEKDKFKIDQYVMNGGKVLWLIDPINASLDSLRNSGKYFPGDYPLNLDDLLFNYGIRLNTNLVLDMRNSRIPLATGMLGNAPQFDLFRYPYHLVAAPRSNHPIVKSLGPINLRFASSIDTTVSLKSDIKRTIILESSERSRVQYIPLGLDFEFLRYDLDPEKFKKQHLPIGMLLEGVFPSEYKNKVSQSMLSGLSSLNIEFKAESVPTSMVVVADGDIIRNPVKRSAKSHGPLGYNEFEKYTFANKDFLINTIEYLIDSEGVIEARGKEIKLRLLNTAKAQAEEAQWQSINIVLPLIFLLLFGLGYNWFRKRSYAS